MNNVTLPRLYYSVGKRVARLAELPRELVPYRERIKLLEAGLADTRQSTLVAQDQLATGLEAKAEDVGQDQTWNRSKATANAASHLQIQAAYEACGREAIHRFGIKAIPKELQETYSSAVDQMERLNAEIEELRARNPVGLITPQRIVLAGGSIAGVLLALFLLRSVGSLLFAGSQAGVNQHASAKESGHPSGAANSEPVVNATAPKTSRSLTVLQADEILRELRNSEPFVPDNLTFKADAISEDAAAILSKCPSNIFLNNVTSLGVNEAVLLAQHSGRGWSKTSSGREVFIDTLALPSLEELPPDVAAALGRRTQGWLILGETSGLQAISDESAESLSQYSGRILEIGVKKLSNRAQDVLAGCRAKLTLKHGPVTLSSAKLARKLCEDAVPGVGIVIDCAEITPEAARALCDAGGEQRLSLMYITTLSAEVARILQQYRGVKWIAGDIRNAERELPPDVAKLLDASRL